MFAPTVLEAAVASSVTMALDAIIFAGLAWTVGALLVNTVMYVLETRRGKK